MRFDPVLPGGSIGVLGGGQLGRMLALEARRMGYRTVVLDPDPAAPAGQVADAHLVAPLSDRAAVRELAGRCQVVTLEWENADVEAIRALEPLVAVRPGAEVLAVAQNRLLEKDAARRLGLETTDYRRIAGVTELESTLADFGTPAVLKTARGGYDAKGQRVIRDLAGAAEAFEALGAGTSELILERWVDFRLEISVISARSAEGEMASFPVAENVHRGGILDVTVAPARVPGSVLRRAREIGEALAEGLGVVGMLAVELFVDGSDRVLVNEIAPRPHNSGHYTWEACTVSQFEQQLRAVCGLPLVRPELLRPAAMANLLGEDVGTLEGNRGLTAALALPGVSLHLYGKREARTGRKMGHLTALAADPATAERHVRQARRFLTDAHAALTTSGAASDTFQQGS